jgi:hypothetical protein
MAAETEAKRIDLQRKFMGDVPKVAAVLQRTGMIQKEVEAALSSANGREFNVIGEINMVLGTA